MSSHPDTLSSGTVWYAQEGPEQDVVLATRIRLVRNLANFVFPSEASVDDLERVQALVFDAFSKADNPDRFQHIGVNQLDFSARQLLAERGVLPERNYAEREINSQNIDIVRKYEWEPGIVVRTDGRVSCLVNGDNHVAIVSYTAGYNIGETWALGKEIDSVLQKSLQFAASYDFGYLTSDLMDAGSGMQLSVRLFLPGLLHSQKIKETIEKLSKQNCLLEPVYGGTTVPFEALGAYYQLTSRYCFTGNEENQVAEFDTVVMTLCASERKARQELITQKPTVLQHIISKMFAVAKFSKFLECSEAIEIVSAMNLGVSAKAVLGIDFSELYALLYRVRNGHINYLKQSSSFLFEKDVTENTSLVTSRLRCLLVQEALEDVKLYFE